MLGTLGYSNQLTFDGKPRAKGGGVTIDWTTVAAVSGSDVTLADGTVIPVGQKYLPTGQVIVRITSVVNGSTVGMYGPYDPAATDGRQTLLANAEAAFLLNRPAIATEPKDTYPEAIYGGRVFQARILQSGVAGHTLALGPTLAEVKTTFPLLEMVLGQ